MGQDESYYPSTLTTVILSDTTRISEYAFEGIHSLQSVSLPSTLTTIGYGAFTFNENLTEIFIPKSVIHMSTMAFWHSHTMVFLIEAKSDAGWQSGWCSGPHVFHWGETRPENDPQFE